MLALFTFNLLILKYSLNIILPFLLLVCSGGVQSGRDGLPAVLPGAKDRRSGRRVKIKKERGNFKK